MFEYEWNSNSENLHHWYILCVACVCGSCIYNYYSLFIDIGDAEQCLLLCPCMQCMHLSGDLLHFYTGDGICSVFCQFVSKIRGYPVAIIQVDKECFQIHAGRMQHDTLHGFCAMESTVSFCKDSLC